jgi:hypothetical protein
VNKFDNSRHIHMLFAVVAEAARSKENEQRSQAFAACIHNVVADVFHQGNTRMQLFNNQRIYGGKIFCDGLMKGEHEKPAEVGWKSRRMLGAAMGSVKELGWFSKGL